ncbi:Mif2/CENP-C like-domain-containing protein [Crucibulum laeve]|uniref:CENP-C homolog n=1 Tax=Crucibulum laeve TaxID=68775 RepID=A0A5C3LU02_9AGAR|nr:Mif2/CENP-C like-domain-containing protein [Crucibulum laeve]
MPTSARKSSVGTSRRGPQKAHIPYRGDNPEVGKKTGIAVRHVERKSDGFEPFDAIMEQADSRTPPKPKGRKRKYPELLPEDEDDGNGEMSMELDDSPLHYFSNARPPSTPTNLTRNGSSSRIVARTSDVDFDELPSPRRRASSLRPLNNGGPGPSTLSKSHSARDLNPSSDASDDGGYDDGGMGNGFDDFGPQEGPSPEQPTPRRTSFSQINEDDEEDEGDDPDADVLPQPTPGKRDKGKGRASAVEEPSEDDASVEDGIAESLADVDMGHYSDEEEDEPQAEPELEPEPQPKKKVKMAEEGKKSRVQSVTRNKKENRPQREGVRRSHRQHYGPLEWWRGEKLVYGKTESSGPVLVPPIREIRRIPKENPEPLGTKRKRGSTRARSRSAKPQENAAMHPPIAGVVLNPEEGWDDDTDPTCTVLSYDDQVEVRRRIAWTAKMVNPKMAANNDWSFDKIFGDGEFIAAGQLVIPPGGRKPSKATKDNTYIFYVIEGAVNLKIHDTSLILATGGMFMVPRGNTYFIENISDRDTKLFFTQARKVPMSASGGPDSHRRSSAGRASSAAAVNQTQPVPAAKRAQSTKI